MNISEEEKTLYIYYYKHRHKYYTLYRMCIRLTTVSIWSHNALWK